MMNQVMHQKATCWTNFILFFWHGFCLITNEPTFQILKYQIFTRNGDYREIANRHY